METNKLYNDDCIKVMDMIEPSSIDCIITDPPYGMSFKSNSRQDQELFPVIKGDDYDNTFYLLNSFINRAYRVLKDNSCMYCFCRFDIYPLLYDTIIKEGFNIKNLLIWVKNGGALGDLESSYINNYELVILAHKGRKILWDGGIGRSFAVITDKSLSQDILHPTQKPLNILTQFIRDSTNKNDIVLDPFMGSGSTIVSCVKTDRRYIGIDIDERYYNITKDRLKVKTLGKWC